MKKISYLMKQTKVVASWLCVTFLLVTTTMNNNVYGNAIALSAISVNQGASTVSFTITWQNSWRIAAGTAPYNWDAAWVFVKFRDCSAPTTTQFTHGAISTTVADHNFDGDGNGAKLEPTTSDGVTIPGIDADGTGVMLRQTSVTGPSAVTETVVLKVNNLPGAGTLDVRVFAIEMVFCAGGATGGPHYVGDGNGATDSFDAFTTGTTGCNLGTAIQITNENAITVYIDPSTNCPSGSRALTANFQKGYAPFFIMKYEISQGQYTDFLNTLTTGAANTRYPGSYNINRHRIQWTASSPPSVYGCDRPDRACNYIGWADVSAYLDWAALRPLTELEYEKAGRGFVAKSVYEYAWGNTTITNAAAAGISPNANEDGTEVISTANANVCANNVGYTTGDGRAAGVSPNQGGPLRCGIFAQAGSTTRPQTGGSYFGVMDLSGNVDELYLAAPCGVAGQPCATGVLWGNGALDASGNQDVASWPPYNTATNVDRRGGNWSTTTVNGTNSGNMLQLSNRYSYDGGGNFYPSAALLARSPWGGGRGGR